MCAYGLVLLTVQGALAVALLAAARGGLDPAGRPLGTDFLSFYAASALALAGHAADAYRPTLHHAAEQAGFGRDTGYAAFFYPPTFLLACLPLATLPYLAALAAWLGATFAAYCAVLRRVLAGSGVGVWAVAAFPAVLVDAGHGQNGFLTAA